MKTNTKNEYSNFYSDDGSREAIVFKYSGLPAWYVDLYENEELVESRKMQTKGILHNEMYAENCAENWVMKIF